MENKEKKTVKGKKGRAPLLDLKKIAVNIGIKGRNSQSGTNRMAGLFSWSILDSFERHC